MRFFILKDAQGRTIKTYGVNQDISERKRAEEEIKRQLAEKEILLREVHHRIKNNIASIGGLLSLHLKSITNPEAIAVLQDAIGRVNSMGMLYDKLLLSEDYPGYFREKLRRKSRRIRSSPCSRAAPRSNSKSTSMIFNLIRNGCFPWGSSSMNFLPIK